jgi:hypothetical protein
VNNELLQALANLTADIAPFWDLILTLSYIGGAIFVVAGLMAMAGSGRQGRGAGSVVVGTLLLGLPAIMDAASQTLFNAQAPRGLSMMGSGGGPGDTFVLFAVRVAQLTGLIGLVKGLSLLRNAGDGRGGGIAHGATYVTAGILCINIVPFMRAVGGSIGGMFQQVVTRLFGGG